MDFTSALLILGIGIGAGIAISAAVAARARARQPKRPRVVELPNSAYTSKLVRDRDTQRRWQSIPLDQLHEINRVEVKRLLARVASHGVDALRPAERAFLETLSANVGPPEGHSAAHRSSPAAGEAVREHGAPSPHPHREPHRL